MPSADGLFKCQCLPGYDQIRDIFGTLYNNYFDVFFIYLDHMVYDAKLNARQIYTDQIVT